MTMALELYEPPTNLTVTVARELPSALLFKLERAGEISRQILNERVAEWVAAGWTQRRMADEMGCSHQAVSQRLARLGIATAARRRGEGRPSFKQLETADEFDPAAIDEPTDLATAIRDATEVADSQTFCPTCGGTGLVPVRDVLDQEVDHP